jgi:hypothetical protein
MYYLKNKMANIFNVTSRNVWLSVPNKYENGEKVSVSNHDMMSRIHHEFNGCFEGFNWTNACVAGGLLSGLIEAKYDPVAYKDSDIDLFIYGMTEKEVKVRFSETLEFLVKKFDDSWIVPYQSSATMCVNLYTSGMRRPIQIIGVWGVDTPLNLIKGFDLSHCQIAYDGINIVCTDQFITSLAEHVTHITKPITKAYRLVKACIRGYSVMSPSTPINFYNTEQDGTIRDTNAYRNKSKPVEGAITDFSKITLESLRNDANVIRALTTEIVPDCKLSYLSKKIAVSHSSIDHTYIADYVSSHSVSHFNV